MHHHTSHPHNGGRRHHRLGHRTRHSRTLHSRALRLLGLFAIAVVVLLLPHEAMAGTGGVDLPWNTPLQNLLDNMTGSTARILAGLMLVVGGIVWGFTRNEEGAKRFGQAIVAIALMFGAVQIVNALAFAGGVL
jgi:type IV secretion system protein VirB2